MHLRAMLAKAELFIVARTEGNTATNLGFHSSNCSIFSAHFSSHLSFHHALVCTLSA